MPPSASPSHRSSPPSISSHVPPNPNPYPYTGKVEKSNMGFYRITNPINGETLILMDIARPFHDPVTGALLAVQFGQVHVMTPPQFQRLERQRNFFVKSEPDIMIQTQRMTTKHFGPNTNEKVGTSGSVTGIPSTDGFAFGTGERTTIVPQQHHEPKGASRARRSSQAAGTL